MPAKKLKFFVVHGPNLNLLGEREPQIYGTMTLSQLNAKIQDAAKKMNVTLKIFQSNGEGALIDAIHRHRKWADGIVINPGAYTHYSYALRDAISSVNLPAVEVHLSDIQSREEFRRVSVIAPVCVGQFMGYGWASYAKGFEFLVEKLRSAASPRPGVRN